MNITNKYLETMFNPMYFAEELLLNNYNKVIYCVLDEESTANYQDFSIIGRGNRVLVKSDDVKNFNIEEEMPVTLLEVQFIVKSISKNNNGTSTLVMEKL